MILTEYVERDNAECRTILHCQVVVSRLIGCSPSTESIGGNNSTYSNILEETPSERISVLTMFYSGGTVTVFRPVILSVSCNTQITALIHFSIGLLYIAEPSNVLDQKPRDFF